ncbi:MAG: hypothetical protein WC975_15465 [Phycisphaerae bacterium]
MKSVLDKEEKELLESVERGEWNPVPHQDKEKKRIQKMAKAFWKQGNKSAQSVLRKVKKG